MFSSNFALLALEGVVYLLASTIAIAFSGYRFKWADALKDRYMRVARKRRLSILLVMAVVLVVRGALITVLPTPVPGVHDEYSYLLGGDTFSSGRFTNPPHPLWKSLETFYVIQQPTYASMYPPAQGIALAVGELLGHPWIGVYLSVALMCGAICWMLQGWVPPQWALLGALIAVLRWGVYSYWMESYWGGAVAALGGAIVAGALPRLHRQPSVRAAVALGIGLLILANSRPFEGLLFTVSMMGMLSIWVARQKKPGMLILMRRVTLPFAAVLVVGALSMSYYFWRVTGTPFRMPYQVHSATYEVTGPFIWQPLRQAPSFRYVVMQKYHVLRQSAAFIQTHALRGWLFETWRKAESLAVFYLWPAILPTLIAIPLLRHNAKVRLAVVAAVLMFIGLTLEIWPMTLHYHAPLTALMVLLLVQVIRCWRAIVWRGRPVGAAISWAIPLFCAGMLAVRLGAAVMHIPVPEHGLAPWFTVTPGNLDRARVQRYLEGQPGLQIVLVRYSDSHHVDEEWVHNAADIDRSKVVWAREADSAQNTQLLNYFRARRAWLLEVDNRPPKLTILNGSTASWALSSSSPHQPK
jgi:hypothetical protein